MEGGDPRLRRRRPALRAARDVLGAGRALQRGARQAGRATSRTSSGTRRGWSCCAWTTSSPTRRGRDGRGPLDRLAPRAPHRARHGELDGFRLLARRARALRRVLDRALRLVPRAREAAAVRGGQRRRSRRRSCGRSSGRCALLHPVMPFVTEEIWSLHAGRERGLLAVAAWPEPDPSRFDEEAEADRRAAIEAVTALRRYRDEAGVKRERARARRAERGRLRRGCAGQLARLARFEWADGAGATARRSRRSPIPGGAVEVLPSEAFDAGEAERASRARGGLRSGDRARGAQARERGLRREGAGRGGRGRARASSRSYRERARAASRR